MSEFGTCLLTILAFNYAASYGVNAGVAGVLFPLSSVFVSIVSYFIFEERLAISQVVGMFVVIAGATLIVMFPAENEDTGDKTTGK